MPMARRASGDLDEDAKLGRRAMLKPRAPIVVDVDEEAEKVEQEQERNLAELRRKALAALNVGLPPSCHQAGNAEPTAASNSRPSKTRCTCLRRSGRCTCNEDREWLQSKRKDASTYNPPHSRRGSEGESSCSRAAAVAQKRSHDSLDDADSHASAPCKQDNAWLHRKRRPVVPYVPPHVKERSEGSQRTRLQHTDAEAAEREKNDNSSGVHTDSMSETACIANGRNNVLSMQEHEIKSDSRLDQRGESKFNRLQMDEQIVLEDTEGLVVECVDHPLSVKGVKGLPVIQSGRYQYEVELLRDSSMMLGCSGAMTLPGSLDFQGYAYSSSGSKWHGQEESDYAKPYGKKGDIVGALIDWDEPEAGSSSSVQISFCLNGELLGPAFKVAASLVDAKKEAPVPLQPHICQLPKGDMLKVRLRGSKAGLPLAHPVEGYQPLSAVADVDFCPFSAAIAAATSERVIMNLTPDDLQSFRLPESHIVELYDFPCDTSAETLTSSVACFLGLKRYLGVLHVCITEGDSSTALAACRRPEHAEQLIEASQVDDAFGVADCIGLEKPRDKPLRFEARPLSSAAARSKQCLRQWQGEAFRAR